MPLTAKNIYYTPLSTDEYENEKLVGKSLLQRLIHAKHPPPSRLLLDCTCPLASYSRAAPAAVLAPSRLHSPPSWLLPGCTRPFPVSSRPGPAPSPFPQALHLAPSRLSRAAPAPSPSPQVLNRPRSGSSRAAPAPSPSPPGLHPLLLYLLSGCTRSFSVSTGATPTPFPSPPGLHQSPSQLLRGCTRPFPDSVGAASAPVQSCRLRSAPVPSLAALAPSPSPQAPHPPGPRLPAVPRGGRAADAPPRTRAVTGGRSSLSWKPPRRGRAQYLPARLAASACCPRTSRVVASSHASV